MEHVNDDMDNLFRRAGELYPLKTSESDWDGVLGKLQDEISGETGTPFAVPARGNSNRRRWLLLLLVSASIFSLVYFSGSRIREKTVQSVTNTKNNPDTKKIGETSKITSSPVQANNKNTDKQESKLNSADGNSATVRALPAENRSGKPAGPVSGLIISSANSSNGKEVLSEANSKGDAGNPSIKAQLNNLSGPESFLEPLEKSLSLPVYGLNENPSVYGMPFPPMVSKEISLNSETAKTATKTKRIKQIQ